MKLSTKSIATLMVVTAVAATAPGVSRLRLSKRRKESLFDKLFSVHDRKGEIRAEVLGLSPTQYRELRKTTDMKHIVKLSGFKGRRAFRVALLGYLRGELVQRGWSRRQIDNYIAARAYRYV